MGADPVKAILAAVLLFFAASAAAQLTPAQIEALRVVDTGQLPPAERKEYVRALYSAIWALGLTKFCAPVPGGAVRDACKLDVVTVPGPAYIQGQLVCGLYQPGTTFVLIVLGGAPECAQRVGDRNFFATLAHEYAHLLQDHTARNHASPCARELDEIEAHAIGGLHTPSRSDQLAIIMYAGQCAAKSK